MRRWLTLAPFLLPVLAAHAAGFTDATGRTVELPATIAHVLPAGPPAAVLLEALAPDLMMGWPHIPSPAALAWLPGPVRALPAVPTLSGRQDVTEQIPPLHPDLIVDYGSVTPRYADVDQAVQAKTGIPTVLLDGGIAKIPAALRTLGAALGRQERAELLARDAEAILAAIPPLHGAAPRVVLATGPDGLEVIAPGTPAAEVFTLIGWQLLAPDGTGARRRTSVAAIATSDPDIIIFEDPAMRAIVAASPAWSGLRAVQAGHAYVAPAEPFGWLGEPPSINRLLGVAALSGPGFTIAPAIEPEAAKFMTTFYGQAPNPEQRTAMQAGLQPIAHP